MLPAVNVAGFPHQPRGNLGAAGSWHVGRQDAADWGRCQSTMIALLSNAQEGWPRW